MAVRAKVRCTRREISEVGASIMQRGPNIGKVRGLQDAAEDAKYITGEVVNGECMRQFTFIAVYSDDPNHENHTWSKYTPFLELKMSVTNPSVDFEAGREYSLDFSRGLVS